MAAYDLQERKMLCIARFDFHVRIIGDLRQKNLTIFLDDDEFLRRELFAFVKSA